MFRVTTLGLLLTVTTASIGQAQTPKTTPIPTPTPTAVPISGGWGIGCYHRICIGIDAAGNSRHIDLNNNTVTSGPKLNGKGPFAVSCEDSEYCGAIDASGQVWKGGLRPPATWVQGPKL
jgi:hypothetical protein